MIIIAACLVCTLPPSWNIMQVVDMRDGCHLVSPSHLDSTRSNLESGLPDTLNLQISVDNMHPLWIFILHCAPLSFRFLTDVLNGHTSLLAPKRVRCFNINWHRRSLRLHLRLCLLFIASTTQPNLRSPAACEFVGLCTSVGSCHHRLWDRLSYILRTAKPSCCHTIGTSSIGSWLSLL